MEHGDIVLRLLAPADQNPAEAIHPAMCPLYHIAPGLVPRLAFELLRRFPLRWNMGGEAEGRNDFAHLVTGIALVQAEILRCRTVGRRALDRDTIERLRDHLHVGAVGPVHGQADGDAVALNEQTALDALFGAVGGVFACLFPPRGVPWSCTRPCSATTSPGPGSSRTPANRHATWRRRRHLGPIPGS